MARPMSADYKYGFHSLTSAEGKTLTDDHMHYGIRTKRLNTDHVTSRILLYPDDLHAFATAMTV